MTGRDGKKRGRLADRVVRKTLKDGTEAVYRYPRARPQKTLRIADRNGLRTLAIAYTASPEFRRLSARWQEEKRRYLGVLEDEIGWMKLADFSRPAARTEFYRLRDRFADVPSAADKTVATLGALLAWAEERGMIERNRAAGIERLSESAPRKDQIWTRDDEEIAVASFPADVGQALRMAILTGMRQADMCALRWDQYRGGWIAYQPSKTKAKTGVWVHLPVFALPALEELVAELSRATEFMLTSRIGQPWLPRNLRLRFLRAKRRSPLAGDDLHWHDLRGTCITRLYEAGCTDAEVGAISGHALGQSTAATDYAARSRRLAENAYRKLAGGAPVIRLVSG